MLDKLRRWLFEGAPDPDARVLCPARPAERTTFDSDDLSWFFPPCTVSDPAAWDEFWRAQVDHGVVGFVDMFCDDGWLVDARQSCGLASVLCVGAGVSMEPRALAEAGFDVTVLDLSPLAIDVVNRIQPPAELVSRLLDGRPAAPGGALRAVAGDLRDPAICPGPYDVIVERKTLQLFSGDEHAAAVAAVANRLGDRGIFFSQAHNGGWRPPQPLTHPNRQWFADRGWPRWQGPPLDARAVHLFMSTG